MQNLAYNLPFANFENNQVEYFKINNRRFLGNKYKLINFLSEVIKEKCDTFESFCDIFAGTGIVGHAFNSKSIQIVSNDLLKSSYVCLKTFLGISRIDVNQITERINELNDINPTENYFSINFGDKYFTNENAMKIGAIREKIEKLNISKDERYILLTSLLYSVDKVANTVGHYDAFRKKLDNTNSLHLKFPFSNPDINSNNLVYNENANSLIRKVKCDVLYIDPPYNSRQYSDTYHLLENLILWEKPLLYGIAKKMTRSSKLKSAYCLKEASKALEDLIYNSQCKHIFLSYNNTGNSKNGRSNARISDNEIIRIMSIKGKVEIFEFKYRAFTTGKSETRGHTERLFYCNVNKRN